MAKRFIDTEIWKKKWFRELPAKLKLTWFFLFTNCTHAGIYELDLELMAFLQGQKVTDNEIKQHLGNQIAVIDDDKWYLTKFVKYQYGELNPNVKAHASVLNLLDKYNIAEIGLLNPLDRVQDIDKVKDKVKVKDKKDVGINSIDFIMIRMLQVKNPRVNVEIELDKFKDWLSSKGKTYKDYPAGFRNWLKSEFVTADPSGYERLKREIKKAEQSANKRKIETQMKNDEIGGPPPEFLEEVAKLTRKMSVNE
jgi:hypothetical protein